MAVSEITYELQKTFQYAYKGDLTDANFITLSEPSYKQMEKFISIKQDFVKAIEHIQSSQNIDEQVIQDAKKENSEDETLISASDAISMMYTSNVDMVKFFVKFQELFRTGIAMVDGETVMTKPMLDKMSIRDFEMMSGTYVANFIAPSLKDG